MGDATHDLIEAARLPEGDVIRLLLEQHARIKTLFEEVRAAFGEERSDLFAELRALLAVHETAEQLVLRPMTEKLVPGIAADRTLEETVATEALVELEKVDCSSPAFAAQI